MNKGCTSSSCGESKETCSAKKSQQKSFLVQPHNLSSIKRVIGIVSGKGGVGKSSLTAQLAVSMNKKGYNSAILDADITGPSIPKLFGIDQKAYATNEGFYPVPTKTGIDIMSINLILNEPTDPVMWRGSMISGAVKQFWNEVIWQDVDYMFIDMPPGTGDVPLTVFQSIPLDGIIIVTSPQDLVSMIVTKAVKMAKTMKVPIIGIVENYSYFKCPDCDQKHYIFGQSKIEEVAMENDIKVLGRLSINTQFAELCDKGCIEDMNHDFVTDVTKKIIEYCDK